MAAVVENEGRIVAKRPHWPRKPLMTHIAQTASSLYSGQPSQTPIHPPPVQGCTHWTMPVWLSYPSPNRADGAVSTKHYLFFFVPGNPGFIDYYGPFLATLRGLLDDVERRSHCRFTLLGRNLLGFDDGDDGDGDGLPYGARPFTLDAQIRAIMDAVTAARIDTAGGPRHGEPFDEVLLGGHSVGSYIALEVFRRHQDRSASASPDPSPDHAHLRLRAGFLLFATLTHLAQSTSGRRLERLLETPLLGPRAPWLAESFLACWPTAALHWIVRSLLGFPPHAADVTARFLASQGGVRQALFLGADELAHIREDEWADEVWEVAEESEAARAEDDDDASKGLAPKFVILFGQNDHWVANEYRERFIARRAEHAARDGPLHKKGRTRIIMDERNMPHAFCLHHGEQVAEMVHSWMADILDL